MSASVSTAPPKKRLPSSLSPVPEQRVGGIGGRASHRRDHGRVGVQREAAGAVPKSLADGLRVQSSGEQVRCVRVSQVVETRPRQLEIANEAPTPSNLRIRLLDTAAGRTAAALLEDELLDVELSRNYPPVVRLM